MALPPPWGTTPSGFVLDGVVLSTRTPPTRHLVPALLVDDSVGNSSGLFTVIAFADGSDAWLQLSTAIMRPGSLVSLDLMHAIADRLFETHIGIPRWTAAALWQQAVGSWMLVDGELQLRGLDVFSMPFDRATNAIYALIRGWQTGDKATLDRWVRKVTQPPLREINRWKTDDVPIASAPVDDMAERMAKMKRQQRENKPTPVAGATIRMPDSDTLRRDTTDQHQLP